MELAPKMQDVTLDVIMSGIFGVVGRPEKGTSEYRLAAVTRKLTETFDHADRAR